MQYISVGPPCALQEELPIAAVHERVPSAQQMAHLRSKFAISVPALGHALLAENRRRDIPMGSAGVAPVERLQCTHVECGEPSGSRPYRVPRDRLGSA